MSTSLSSQFASLAQSSSSQPPARVIQHSGLADTVDAIRQSIYRTMLLVRAPMGLGDIEEACETPPGHAKGHIKALMKQGRVRPAKDKFIAIAE